MLIIIIIIIIIMIIITTTRTPSTDNGSGVVREGVWFAATA